MSIACPYCIDGTNTGLYAPRKYPCPDCMGEEVLKECKECNQLLGLFNFEGDSEICNGCKEDMGDDEIDG